MFIKRMREQGVLKTWNWIPHPLTSMVKFNLDFSGSLWGRGIRTSLSEQMGCVLLVGQCKVDEANGEVFDLFL